MLAQLKGWTMVIAALVFTPLTCGETVGYPWRSVSWKAWAGLIYGATAGMAIAMALWGRAVHRLGPYEYRKKTAPFHAVPPARGASAPLPPAGAAAAGAARGRLRLGLGWLLGLGGSGWGLAASKSIKAMGRSCWNTMLHGLKSP